MFITVRQINKRYKNNDSDSTNNLHLTQILQLTYLINSSGDLVRRVNHEGALPNIYNR